jgi:uncharacterized membrane protein
MCLYLTGGMVLIYLFFVPFVIFQSLLCVKDHNTHDPYSQKSTLSVTEVTAPLLSIVGLMISFVIFVLCISFRSNYKVITLTTILPICITSMYILLEYGMLSNEYFISILQAQRLARLQESAGTRILFDV